MERTLTQMVTLTRSANDLRMLVSISIVVTYISLSLLSASSVYLPHVILTIKSFDLCLIPNDDERTSIGIIAGPQQSRVVVRNQEADEGE